MSLSQALSASISGLRAAQAGMAIVGSNVANSETPGYIRKSPVQLAVTAGDVGIGVRMASINRELDQYVQRQLRVEVSGASYANLRATYFDRMQRMFGSPGSDSALETIFNGFSSALQSLSTSPDSVSARSAAVSAAQVLAQKLNSMSNEVQALRTDTELGLSDGVAKANEAMRQIARINQHVTASGRNDATTAAMLDQRDAYIDQLAQLMDIRVTQGDNNQVTIFTNSGVQLVGLEAAQFAFDPQGTMTPSAEWNVDPAKRTVGTISLVSPTGGSMDLIANKVVRSGQIAALLEMRDDVLVQAQKQLDEMAAAMARALSERTTPITAGPSGFDVDLASLEPGNKITLTYTDATNKQHKVTIVRVDDPKALPLKNDLTADPNDTVIGVDFSGGPSSVVDQLNRALGPGRIQFSNPSGNTLRVDDDGSGLSRVDAVATKTTVTSLTSGGPELPLFLDGGDPFTGAITSSGSQTVGFAGRISVNAALIADPSKMVIYQTTPETAASDATRPRFLYDQMVNASLEFSPQSGIGSASAPFNGSLSSFMRQVISVQGEAAEGAKNLKAGQDVVLNTLQGRFAENSGVNIDQEMTNLLNLQNAYAANARVMSTINEMFQTLMRA